MSKLVLILAVFISAISISSCTIEGTFTPADESVNGYWSPSE